MTLLSLLAIGLLAGVRHALEADHVAAVASLATRTASARAAARLAAAWGAGHAVVLMLVGGLVVALGAAVPPGLARAFEITAGLLVVLLGLDVLRRLRDSAAGPALPSAGHAHPPAASAVSHARLHARALLVGGVHGMAGSAALVVLALQAVSSVPHALAYVAVFSAGSIAGMVAFSLALAVPFTIPGRRLRASARALEAVVGAASVAAGGWMVVRATLG